MTSPSQRPRELLAPGLFILAPTLAPAGHAEWVMRFSGARGEFALPESVADRWLRGTPSDASDGCAARQEPAASDTPCTRSATRSHTVPAESNATPSADTEDIGAGGRPGMTSGPSVPYSSRRLPTCLAGRQVMGTPRPPGGGASRRPRSRWGPARCR